MSSRQLPLAISAATETHIGREKCEGGDDCACFHFCSLAASRGKRTARVLPLRTLRPVAEGEDEARDERAGVEVLHEEIGDANVLQLEVGVFETASEDELCACSDATG